MYVCIRVYVYVCMYVCMYVCASTESMPVSPVAWYSAWRGIVRGMAWYSAWHDMPCGDERTLLYGAWLGLVVP